MSTDERDLVKDFRQYADHPAGSGFVPISPTTLRAAADEIERLRGEVSRLLGFMPEHDTRESYRCTECGAFHLRRKTS